MTSPYRIHDKSRKDRPSAELVYLAQDQEKHVGPARAAIQLSIAGGVSGMTAAGVGHPQIGAAIFAGTVLFGIWRWRRAPEIAGLLLHVDDGVLSITERSTKRIVVQVQLADLENVSLDTKSIRKVTPGQDAVPATRFIHSQVGPEIDVARIVLETSARPTPIHLSETFLAYSETVEWIAKIRMFLRSHGWLPTDEREPEHDLGDD